MRSIQLVVFDMAGTTVRDDGQVPRAFAEALAHHGIEATDARIAQVRGASKREAVRRFVTGSALERERLSDAAYATFREKLSREFADGGVRAIAGAAELFEWLRTNDVRVALNTGFDRDITTLLLSALRWHSGVVDAVLCGDDVPEGRPAPHLILGAMHATGVADPNQVANVGDTVLDLEAGRNAAVKWNIGVLSGAHDRAALERAPHTHIVRSIADLPRLFVDWSESR